MRHGTDGHLSTHHVHGCFAHKATTQYQRMSSIRLQPLSHLQGLIDLHASLESVAHVGLDQHGDITTSCLHHLLHHHIHEAHPIGQRSTKLVLAVIGVR